MKGSRFDGAGRFVIEEYPAARPFSSFLPGIAGPLGIPMWVFYVNRGQAIASFGVESKDNPIMEFQPANKAYQTTPYTGFRTFLKLKWASDTVMYEPFAPWPSDGRSDMFIGMNELELETTSAAHGIQTNVLYFAMPGEMFAGLVRQVTVRNVGTAPVALEMLDGMPCVTPYGVDNQGLKEIGRTLEAWMGVSNLEQGVPFYRCQASFGDTAEVEAIQSGHFYLAFTIDGNRTRLLFPFVDPDVVFGYNTALTMPDRFATQTLAELEQRPQVTTGRTPCGFFGMATTLGPTQSLTVFAIIGHISHIGRLADQQERLMQAAYVQQKRDEATRLTRRLTDAVETKTGSSVFDAYCRQTFLDNVLRGGWPLMLGSEQHPLVYHVYSRKHGDLERDYNAFYVAAEPYSQGNGGYRDVNQNRRCDVWLEPAVKDHNVLAFLGLIQLDGYNPLVVGGSRFTVPSEHHAPILALVDQPDKLQPLLDQPFTPGQLLKAVADQEIGLAVTPEAFVASCLTEAEQLCSATYGQGYWIDHWTYNLDLIDTYLAVYPEKKAELLFSKPVVPYYDSPAVVQPRAVKYVLTARGVRQYGAVLEDREKAALIASRDEKPNLMRTAHSLKATGGQGDVYRTTVFAKLVGLALVKFATLDPLGMGVEMEAGKPGWYDALNGLPGLFGSSLCETYELKRLLSFLLQAVAEKGVGTVELSIEQAELMERVVEALQAWCESDDADRDFRYWDTVATARETYRDHVRLGSDGDGVDLPFGELGPILAAFQAKVSAGTQRAVEMNDGIPPTYFAYTVTGYDLITDASGEPRRDEQGRPYIKAKRFEPTVLPLFLEGPVHALKVQPDVASARDLFDSVKASDLYDRKLNMYKVNASLAGQSHEIGRARAFTPGWLENESIWLHMEYKYLLEVLKAGLYEEFFEDFERALIPFQDPRVYGRSPLENSSFLVSSAHPDPSLHGTGFVARLSGSTAEFLNMWTVMLAGQQPFFVQGGRLCLSLKPTLPGWLFTKAGTIAFRFLNRCTVTYHNPKRLDTYQEGVYSTRIALAMEDGSAIEVEGRVIGAPHAAMIREGEIRDIQIWLDS